MTSIATFFDVANLEGSFRAHGLPIDYLLLRDFLVKDRALKESFAYVPRSPFAPERRDRLVSFLRRHGFLVRSKVGKKRPAGKWKCDFDVEMTWDISKYIDRSKADVIVVACGDRDLMPVYQSVRALGVEVEVASTQQTVASDIMEAASRFIDLGESFMRPCNTENQKARAGETAHAHADVVSN